MTHPMLTLLRQAKFMTSAPRLSACPPNIGYEVAFAGRSNAGKSSAINALTNQRQLARASKTPGRTQLLNYFSLDEERRLVDLPGYGYAAVPLAMKEAWQKELEKQNIESRALWKPLHQQPVFDHCKSYINGISDNLYDEGLCLSSGSNMTDEIQTRVINEIKQNLI